MSKASISSKPASSPSIPASSEEYSDVDVNSSGSMSSPVTTPMILSISACSSGYILFRFFYQPSIFPHIYYTMSIKRHNENCTLYNLKKQ